MRIALPYCLSLSSDSADFTGGSYPGRRFCQILYGGLPKYKSSRSLSRFPGESTYRSQSPGCYPERNRREQDVLTPAHGFDRLPLQTDRFCRYRENRIEG